MLDYSKVAPNEILNVDELNAIGTEAWTTEFFSPYKPKSFVFQCKDGERVVGCEGYLDYLLFYNGELCQTHRSERTLISPTHRGQGIFEALVLECDSAANAQQSHMCWGATAALKPFVRAGFDPFVGYRNYIFYPAQRSLISRLTNILRSLDAVNPFGLYRAWKSRNIEEIKRILAFFCLFKPQNREKAILQIAAFSEAHVFDMLRRNSQSNYVIYPHQELFAWLSEKNLSYGRHSYFIDGACVGYVIFKMSPATRILHVVDLFSTDPCWVVAMIDKLVETYSEAGMSAVFLALNEKNTTHSAWIKQFRTARALIFPKVGSFIIKTLAGAPKKIEIQDLLLTDLWLEL